MAVQLVQEVVVKVLLLNMKVFLINIIGFLFSVCAFSQTSIAELLKKYNLDPAPYISVEELNAMSSDIILLDARESNEFEVSHLKNAIYVGYENFKLENVEKHVPNKNQSIVVYCSLGVRSQIISKILIEEGYTNVKNLYGGIFEWKNTNRKIFNKNEIETDSIHAFSPEWSKWLKNGIKVYE